MPFTEQANALLPVTDIEVPGAPEKTPEDGIGLCLSGGGYRAMLYHVGALWRINELGLMHPSQLKRISSVSGGSITAATLGMNWNQLQFDSNTKIASRESFIQALAKPTRRLAQETIDVSAVGWGIINPFKSISDEIGGYYQKYVFGSKTLQDLPDSLRIVFNATNVQTGSLFRFSKPYMVDHLIGMWKQPDVPLSKVVAASSAFPPFLSPCTLDLNPYQPSELYALGKAEPDIFARNVILSDGGVYDNLGLETVWKRFKVVLCSDGGRKMALDRKPAGDWALHSRRLIDLLERQVSALRKRQLIASYLGQQGIPFRHGAYWGITTAYEDYDPTQLQPQGIVLPLSAAQPVPSVANMDTRLATIAEELQEKLINWGYAITDVAIRRYYLKSPDVPLPTLPYPGAGI
ncbi:MAG: patatin-like phospholipase family protein [Planctomycetia bacterium]|nr:patatin-like phospholipase family protein [Planctomycetia bacterium]